MGFIIGLLTLFMVLDCVVLVFLVLIQLPKKDAGAGLAFGGSATDALFGLVRPESIHDRPVPERHRTIFYFGHLEAFDWNLVSHAAGVPSFHPEFDQLFAFGIDPEPGQSPQDKRSDWPERAEVQRYNLLVRQAIDDLSNQVSEQVLSVALEHRLMHAETFAYLLHQLTTTQKDIPLAAL